RLCIAELEQVNRDVPDVHRVVPRDHAAVPEQAAHRIEFVEADRRVEQRVRKDPAQWTADLHRLDGAPRLHAAAMLLQDLTQWSAERDLVHAGPDEALVDRDRLGAAALA